MLTVYNLATLTYIFAAQAPMLLVQCNESFTQYDYAIGRRCGTFKG